MVNYQIKFEKFSETSEEEEEVNEYETEQRKQQQQQPPPSSKQVIGSISWQQGSSHDQYHLHLLPCKNSKKTITFTFNLCLVFAVSVLFLIALIFAIMLAFIFKCDESRLVGHSVGKSSEAELTLSNFTNSWSESELAREKEYMQQKIKWVHFKQIDEESLLPFEPAGLEEDRFNHLLIFVARTVYQNEIVVGKYCAACRVMYFGFSGEEYATKNFEVLSYPSGTLNWMPANLSSIPPKETLVSADKAPGTGGSAYVCRMKHGDQLLVGRYAAGVCFGAWKNYEYKQDTFEMLAVNELGKLLGVQQ